MAVADDGDDLELFFERRSASSERRRIIIVFALGIASYVAMVASGVSIAEMSIIDLVVYFMLITVVTMSILSRRAWVRENGKIIEAFRTFYIFPIGRRELDWTVLNESLWLESTNENRRKKLGTIDAITPEGKQIRLCVETAEAFD